MQGPSIGKSPYRVAACIRDAVHAQVQKCEQGKLTITSELQERLAELVGLLPLNLRASLTNDILDDLESGTPDEAKITRTVTFYGQHIEPSAVKDVDKLIRRIFHPILTNPNETSTGWMLRQVRGIAFPEDLRSEFRSRLSTASKREGSHSWRRKIFLTSRSS